MGTMGSLWLRKKRKSKIRDASPISHKKKACSTEQDGRIPGGGNCFTALQAFGDEDDPSDVMDQQEQRDESVPINSIESCPKAFGNGLGSDVECREEQCEAVESDGGMGGGLQMT